MENDNKIDIIANDNAVSIVLWNAICKHIKPNDENWIALKKEYGDNPHTKITVMCKIAGFEFPILPALKEVIESELGKVHEMAAKIALEKIEEAGIEKMQDAISKIEKDMIADFRNRLKNVGLKFRDED